jgi:hypothetical protein
MNDTRHPQPVIVGAMVMTLAGLVCGYGLWSSISDWVMPDLSELPVHAMIRSK